MKTTLFTLLFIGTAQIAFSQYGFYDETSNKWGLKNSEGEIIVDAKYDFVGTGPYDGMIIINNGCHFDEVGERAGGKWGFLNSKGEEIVPLKYEEAQDFSNGLAPVMLNGMWGFINNKGNTVIEHKYESVCYFFHCGFSEGLSYVKIDGKWGFINENDTLVINNKYDEVNYFSQGLARVSLNGRVGFVDKEGNEVIPLIYDDAGYTFEDGKVTVTLGEEEFSIDLEGNKIDN